MFSAWSERITAPFDRELRCLLFFEVDAVFPSVLIKEQKQSFNISCISFGSNNREGNALECFSSNARASIEKKIAIDFWSPGSRKRGKKREFFQFSTYFSLSPLRNLRRESNAVHAENREWGRRKRGKTATFVAIAVQCSVKKLSQGQIEESRSGAKRTRLDKPIYNLCALVIN